jgi:hypothetical protein
MNTLPKDIIHHILQYNDAIKWRNGRYMNQIPRNDARYELLKTIPPKISRTETIHILMDDGRIMKFWLHFSHVQLPHKFYERYSPNICIYFYLMELRNEDATLEFWENSSQLPIQNQPHFDLSIRGYFTYSIKTEVDTPYSSLNWIWIRHLI